MAAQEHHHDCGRHSDRPYPDLSKTPRMCLHHNPALRDAGPPAPPSSRVKAPGRGGEGLFSRYSSHLLHWSRPSTALAPPGECRGRNTQTLAGKLRPGVCGCSALVGSMTRRTGDTQFQGQTTNPVPKSLF